MRKILSKFITSLIYYFGSKRTKILLIEAENTEEKINESYERAKKRNEVFDFYLGRKKYLHYDREWNCHTPEMSFRSLEAYSKKYGNETMLKSFRNDLIEILKKELKPKDFNCLITYIWIYLQRYYEEKSFEIEWRVEENIRQLIKNQVEIFDFKLFNSLDDKWPSDGFIFKNILQSIQITKDRFGIDLLDVKGS